MNRSLNSLVRVSLLASVVAAVVLSAGVRAPAHATVGPVDNVTEGATRAIVPLVAGLAAPKAAPAGAARADAGAQAGVRQRPPAGYAEGTVIQTSRQPGRGRAQSECMPARRGTAEFEGTVDGLYGPDDRAQRAARPDKSTTGKSTTGKAATGKLAAKPGQARQCGSAEDAGEQGMARSAGDLIAGLTGAILPALPVLGSLGNPQVAPTAMRTTAPSNARVAEQSGPLPLGPLNDVLPLDGQSPLSALLGGLPGMTTGTGPSGALPGLTESLPLAG
ncbi:hypothetical protein SAMN04489712_109214 [Thermomonospora echinospora]|uniref:Small secreted domain n=1 Tax=Thermomonospora echinospora TaxID=1992 RepID=A0A1H6CDL3_9ACTN|nr:hypothetical protein [Thermomonospora echinospora]SEG70867.1 hypothetical protein SAMN04489712_109214 [Thermomonospora echinospora]